MGGTVAKMKDLEHEVGRLDTLVNQLDYENQHLRSTVDDLNHRNKNLEEEIRRLLKDNEEFQKDNAIQQEKEKSAALNFSIKQNDLLGSLDDKDHQIDEQKRD